MRLPIAKCVQIDSEALWDKIGSTDICQKWWVHMAPLMETEPDSVRPKATSLSEVFFME